MMRAGGVRTVIDNRRLTREKGPKKHFENENNEGREEKRRNIRRFK